MFKRLQTRYPQGNFGHVRSAPPRGSHGGVTIDVPPPPTPDQPDGASSAWTSAIPMLGSIGSIALIGSTMGGSRGWLAAGSFLLATCAFVLVQADRHRTQRLRQLDRLRRGYLRTLAGVRRQVRVDAPPAGVPWGSDRRRRRSG